MSLLCVSDLSFSYPENNVFAVKNVSFTVEAGEYVAVLGANGSGKSTLARLICGFLLPDSGTIQLDKDCLTGIVFQSPDDQIVAGIVESDTSFGPQNLGLSAEDVSFRTQERLEAVRLKAFSEAQTLALSQGQKQKLAFAGITAMEPSLLVLDEVTSMLDEASRTEILALTDKAIASGCAVLHITHDIDEAVRAGRIVAMDDGNVIFDGSAQDFVRRNDLAERLFGKQLLPENAPPEQNSVLGLYLDNISFSYVGNNADASSCIFQDFSLSLERGTLTALMGPSGSGKSTLMELAAGLLVPEKGKVLSHGGVALALQDSERALFEEFAADDVAFGPSNQGMSGQELVQRVRQAMDEVGLPFDVFAEKRTQSLSGGQKRKLSLAGIIALDTQVVLFDEPTAGLDPKSRRKVLELLVSLAKEGKTVLFSTHRMDEARFAGRIIRLEGKRPIVTAQGAKPSTGCDTVHLEVMGSKGGTGILAFLHNCGGLFSAGCRKKSPIQSLPPVAKYIVFLAMFLASFVTQNVVQAAVVAAFVLGYAALARYPGATLVKSLLKILPWIVLFFALQLLFLPVPPDDTELFRLGFVSVTIGRLLSGALMLLHLFSAFVCLAVFAYSMTERDVLDGLASLLKPLALCGLPVRHLVLIAGIVFRFVPMLAAEAALIVKVQIIRGGLGEAKGFAAKVRRIFPLFVPLFLRTLRRADSLADALTARHYS